MSLSIGQFGASGLNQILSSGIQRIQQDQQSNTWQATTGTISDSLAGLGNNRNTIIATSPKISEISSYQSNISSIQNRLSMSAAAFSQLTEMTQNLSTQVLTLSSTGGSKQAAVQSVAETARSNLATLGNVLNTSDGMGFIFSGSAENDQTIPSPTTIADSKLAKSISDIVSGLTDNNVSDIFKAATAAAADNSSDMSVFASSLSTSSDEAKSLRKSAITGPGSTSSTEGIVATEGGEASDTSTGSPIRDLMRDMMIVSSLQGMDSTKPGFDSMIKQLNTSLTNTANQLIDMNASIGVQQNSLTRQQGSLQSTKNMFKEQMSSYLDVDMAAVATQSSDLTTRLKASFMLVADTKSMTLANYM